MTTESTEPVADMRLVLPSQETTEDHHMGSIFFVGNATVIIRYACLTIMTDPNFLHKGDHAHLGYGIHTKRLHNPALELDQLPHIDLIVLSHMHEDHFDRLVERKLDRTIPIVTTEHAVKKLHKKGFTAALPLRTWQSLLVEKGDYRLKITSMPGRHAPGILHHLNVLPPVMGSLLEFHQGDITCDKPALYRMYISGDTLVHSELKEIPKRFPDIDLALLHLGGTTVLGLVVTMDARQGIECIGIVQPKHVIPIHYNDYEAFKSPLEDFKQAVKDAGWEDKVSYLTHGEIWNFYIPERRLRSVIDTFQRAQGIQGLRAGPSMLPQEAKQEPKTLSPDAQAEVDEIPPVMIG
eukprot:GILK01012060.1.p1 GENE.GILK01012060.1~~GILK01012060.1.p1  ORF type:complete len:351 (+),score=49.71 GILK01012060.1:121-1173(+)